MAASRKLKSSKPAETPALTETLSPTELGAAARKAAEEILVAGQSENTLISYRSAMRYISQATELHHDTREAMNGI